MHKLRTIESKLVKNKTVLMRVDFNVPLREQGDNRIVVDSIRIEKTLPTIQLLRDSGAKIVLLSHLGRPGGVVDENLRLKPVAEQLASLLDDEGSVIISSELTGTEVEAKLTELQSGQILVLENTRFDPREKENDLDLAKELASYADLFINEGFSVSHRAHASTVGITEFLPAYAGLTFAEEYRMLTELTNHPQQPFVAVVGGAKISDKIEAIRNLTKVAEVVLVGGGIANNFIKAEGINVYKSYLEEEKLAEKPEHQGSYVELAFKLMEENKLDKMLFNDYIPLPKIIYPSDVLAAEDKDDPKEVQTIDLTEDEAAQLDPDLMYLDIGPKTQRLYRDIILQAGTVFWNGPMGVFEVEEFSSGTEAVATAIAKSSAETTIGGGDTLRAIKSFGLEGRFDHISAAGGAALDLLAGQQLPGLVPLLKTESHDEA